MSNICALCSASFEITDKDLAFFEHISPKFNGKKELIPPPTLCADCRVQRRMAWRNDRTFYKRKCDLSGDEFISMYPPDTKFPVYKQDVWHGDGWNPLEFGREVDLTRSFMEQWAELRDTVPHWGVAISNCQNSDFCNYCTDEKNCYLDIAAESNEDCFYDHFVKYSVNCVDCTFCYHSTLLYECILCYNAYNCKHSMYLEDSNDCAFCFDMKGCKDCLLCVNQRGKQYCVLNEQLTKEEYQKRLQELNMSSYASLQKVFELWKKMRIEKGIYRDMYNINCENSSGNNIKSSKNCHHCFNITDCEDCAYLYDVMDAKDCHDINYSPYAPEASYEVISTVGTKFCAFYTMGPYNVNCYYSQMCQSSKNCFGCAGLKQGEYCILNKKYSEEQYKELVPKIIAKMREDGEWGEFFPASLSPHGYNETVAQEYQSLSKEEALRRGFLWRDIPDEIPEVEKIIPADRLPDTIKDIPDDVLNWAVTCEETKKPFRIVKQELMFYRRLGIPLPRRAPELRHRDRIDLRNPRKLWDRKCAKCQKDIRTSYDPERPEKVWCESCYLQEVY